MTYSREFYEDLRHTAESARPVISAVTDLLSPQTVLDVGCGVGMWLKVWEENGQDVHGIDGNWVQIEDLVIEAEKFTRHDLENTFDLHKQFDLVTSLEVAEHIKPEQADVFVNSLVRHGQTILFSAAVPQQGGTNHYNEQWPEYWIEKFSNHDYVFLDPFRHIFWSSEKIRTHYKQNILLFVHKEKIKGNPILLKELEYSKRSLVSVVHPEQYLHRTDVNKKSLKKETLYFIDLLIFNIKKRF